MINPNPTTRRLDLLYPCKPSDPLPLAAVVTSSSSSDVGIVIVYPTSGRILYWENVDSVQSLSLFQQRHQVVEGSVLGILSRDTIERLIDAESAGYLLLFTSGRLAHLTIRDTQGRPHINVLALDTGVNGWLSSWTHALSRGWREKITSIRTRPSKTKGQVEAISLNGEGVFKSWDLSWAGNSRFENEHKALEKIWDALIESRIMDPTVREDVKTLDFALLSGTQSGPQGALAVPNDHGLHVITLVGIQAAASTRYALVELLILSETTSIKRVIPIIFDTRKELRDSNAQLLIPEPERVAFIVSDDAVVIASLDQPRQSISSPDEQLFAESFGPVVPFQDVIYFQRDKGATITTAAVEPPTHYNKHDQSSAVLFTEAAGLVRVAALESSGKEQPSEHRQPTVKSKIEQAVFYGTNTENILDFTVSEESKFSLADVEAAALRLSNEIVNTRTPYLPEVDVSMYDHLDKRANALQDLMQYLKTYYPGISRQTRWQLLWNAEKVRAASGMWRAYEKHLDGKKPGISTLLDQLVIALNEKSKEPLDPEVGQLDAVRQFFTKDVSKIERIFANAARVISDSFEKGLAGVVHIVRWIIECDELWFQAFEPVFGLREIPSNRELYGLESEDVHNGILRSGYAGLPEFWTSRLNLANGIRYCNRYFRRVAFMALHKREKEISEESTKLIAAHQPRLVKICCQMYVERYRWLLEQDDEELKNSGRALKDEYETKIVPDEFKGLAALGHAEQGIKVAEQLREIPALVDLILGELIFYADSYDDTQSSPADRANSKKRIDILENQAHRYFKTFGDRFSTAFYAAEIRDRHLGDLLTKKYGQPGQLTSFLRSDSSCAKFSWINDIINEKEPTEAARALTTVATKQELNIWSKKIELSLAKLALLSEKAPTSSPAENTRRKSLSQNKINADLLKQNHRELVILDIQQQLYRHVRPIVLTALDEAGALDAVVDEYGRTVRNARPHHHELLRNSFEQLLKHQAMAPSTLIDVLTLMDHVHSESNTDDIAGNEFILALKVLDASDMRETIDKDDGEGETTARLIWKRLFVHDDWKAINDTTGKSDSEVAEILESTALFATLKEGTARCEAQIFLGCVPTRANQVTAILNSKPAFAIRPPADVLGAGSSAADLEARFPEPDLRKGFVKDNLQDDKLLQEHMKSARIDYWFNIVKDMALQVAEDEADRMAQDAEQFRQFMIEYKAPEPENDLVDEEEEMVNGVDAGYMEEETEEDEYMISGGRGYAADDEDGEVA